MSHVVLESIDLEFSISWICYTISIKNKIGYQRDKKKTNLQKTVTVMIKLFSHLSTSSLKKTYVLGPANQE